MSPVLVISMIVLVTLVTLEVKNNVTCYQRCKIMDAIHYYNEACIFDGRYQDQIDYNCMKSYDAMLFNPFDWGCKHALSRDKYELVKPYIK